MEKIVEDILSGKIFIYPTDTIYGIGCNALNEKAVEKIKKLKKRERDKPLSVIAPSFDWIEENCVVDVELKKYLPGPYTIILKKKDPEFLKHVSDTDSLGVRIPACEFSEHVKDAGVPFITTSVNLSRDPFARSIEEVPKEILDNVDRIVNEGKLNGEPSTLVIGGKEINR
jgi:L-threonylcarbamoyladenylate synthase